MIPLTNCACILIIVACFCNLGHSETPAMCSVVQGLPGLNGRDGRDGANGPKGDPGARGEPGIPGEKGNTGFPGKVGPKGDPGAKGNTGVTGYKGVKGDLGIGLPGQKGEKGDKECSDVHCSKKTDALESRFISLEKKLSWLEKVVSFHGGKVGGKVFVTNGLEENFDNAQKICRDAGGNLPTPRNAAENSAIEGIVRTKGESSRAVLGITDKQVEGTFRYSTGEKVVFTNWNSREPNNDKGTEDCVEILSNGKWNDFQCNGRRLVICEFQ